MDQFRRCSLLWVSNPDDAQTPKACGATVLPNIPYDFVRDGDPQPVGPPGASQTILTVATVSHPQNREGIDRFFSRSWPAIHAARPRAVWRIVGSGMTPQLRARWEARPGVQAPGFVHDLLEEYSRCAFSVAPLWAGGGTSIKVLESLAFGRTCLVTPAGHRGFAQTLPAGQAIVVAPDESSLAAEAISLLDDPQRRERFASAGRDALRAHYSRERFDRIVEESLRPLFTRAPVALRPAPGRPPAPSAGSSA